MKSALFKIFFCIAAVIAMVAVCTAILLSPRELPSHMISAGRDKVLVPEGYAELYLTSNVGQQFWQFDLDPSEAEAIENCVKEHGDVWFELTGYSLGYIEDAVITSIKDADLSSVSIEGSYYCFVDSYNNFVKAGENRGGRAAVFIWDRTTAKYYCMYNSGR